jgi:hypothetical protein
MTLANIGAEMRDCRLHEALAKVFGHDGYSIDLKLRPDELAELRRLTTKSWLDVIRKAAPDRFAEFEAAGIEKYHSLSNLIDHASIWTTHTRTFTEEVVNTIRMFSLFDLFDRECPGYRITSEMSPYGDLGRARVNWRLVRPGDGTDLGPIHADYWFDAVLDGWKPEPGDAVSIKIWVPIYLEQGLTGFACLPGSHRQHFKFSKKLLPDGVYKPHFDRSDLTTSLKTLATPCGSAVLFNYNLVHQGANSPNATSTRVSMEMTLAVPRQSLGDRYGDLNIFY